MHTRTAHEHHDSGDESDHSTAADPLYDPAAPADLNRRLRLRPPHPADFNPLRMPPRRGVLILQPDDVPARPIIEARCRVDRQTGVYHIERAPGSPTLIDPARQAEQRRQARQQQLGPARPFAARSDRRGSSRPVRATLSTVGAAHASGFSRHTTNYQCPGTRGWLAEGNGGRVVTIGLTLCLGLAGVLGLLLWLMTPASPMLTGR